MTQIQDEAYRTDREGGRGFCFLIAHQLKNITIDPDLLVHNNPCYFGARVERNEQRAKALASVGLCHTMFDTIKNLLCLRAELAEAEAQMKALTKYGAPFSADSTMWERLAGEPEHPSRR
jgi:hypothetical protein